MTAPIGFDAVVAGAGVVGLAVARHLAQRGLNTLIVEAEESFGTGISSRNSEVIHAGLYYQPGTLKARFCVEGNQALYAYCEQKAVPVRRLGKLVIATQDAEVAMLDSYLQRGQQNYVDDLRLLDAAQVHRLEPEVRAVAGLFSASTGIVDTHALMSALLQDFEKAGGTFVVASPILEGEAGKAGFRLRVGGRDPCVVSSPILVNAAGLGAMKLAASLDGMPPALVPELHFAVGHYFGTSMRVPFRHLIYPVAGGGGLGVHLTLDMAGQARFGPDISWRVEEDYRFDASRVASFYAAIRRYWPSLPEDALAPAYTGIRPKLYGVARPDQDFMVQGPMEHGVPGLINLFGIESPGLTSALPIASYVAGLLGVRK